MRQGLLPLWALPLVLGCMDSTPQPGEPGLLELLSGGDTTVMDDSRDAFARPLANLTAAHRSDFFAGNSLFNRSWVTAPSSTTGLDGLGPTFNAASRSACHFKDGRGAPPEADEPFVGLLMRLSVPGADAHGAPLPEPTYGGQFNHRSILGVPAEGEARVTYEEREAAFGDGTPYSLLVPSYRFDALAFGAMAGSVMLSPRVAPALHGLGLLEAVPDAVIEALADPDDADGDGISGRPNYVWDERRGKVALGRFGWKSNQPTIEQQSAGAALGDLGISSPMFPAQNCPVPQRECQNARSGGEPELEAAELARLVLYAQALAVPARRDLSDPDVVDGATLFRTLGCASCHTPTLETGADAALAELANQTIHPYTDLLLHDMGEGLSDGRPDFLATGQEWRTPPLWGLGLVESVNRHTRLLHDGRARNVEESILWHGGEAERAKQAYAALEKHERAQLLSFLRSL